MMTPGTRLPSPLYADAGSAMLEARRPYRKNTAMPQPDHIMALPVPDADAAGPFAAELFAKCEHKLGMVPHVLRAFSARPAKLARFSEFYNELMLGPSGLSKLEREMIAVAVSSVNRCYYCLVAHGQALRKLSGDPELGEMIALNYRVAKLDARPRAMLDFAVKLTESGHRIDDADREALHSVGFSNDDIFDIVDVAAFFNYTNRVAHGLDLMPNRALHKMDR